MVGIKRRGGIMHQVTDYTKVTTKIDPRIIYNKHMYELEKVLKETVKKAEKISHQPLP
jgi:hypothetical protein